MESSESLKNLDIEKDIFGEFMSRDPRGKYLFQILDNIQEMVMVIDAETKIVFVNKLYSQILDKPRKKVIGRTLLQDEPSSRLIEVLKTQKAITADVSHVYTVNMDVIANMAPLFYEDKLIGAVASFQNITEINRLKKEIDYFKNIAENLMRDKNNGHSDLPLPFNNIVGSSNKLYEVMKKAALAANTDATILITGESGVGKELFAEAIHYSSNRQKGALIKINSAAIPETLLESELFGYDQGAFTGAKVGGKKGKFELADGGTLFLDEIGDMSLFMQAKLLRVIQQKEIERIGGSTKKKVDVRIIAATNKNLLEMIHEGTFREDLYYRLSVVPIHIPPLRERGEDIVSLITYFLEEFRKQYNKTVSLSQEAYRALLAYTWPGNIRELKNVLENAIIVSLGDSITLDYLPDSIKNNNTPTYEFPMKLNQIIENVEKEAIKMALQFSGNNKSKAIEVLGISRGAFYQKCRQYHLND